MVWGVAFFQKDLAFSFPAAVTPASMVPLGWVVGCPLLGWLADRVGRRKPPLIWGAVIILLAMTLLAYLPALMPALRRAADTTPAIIQPLFGRCDRREPQVRVLIDRYRSAGLTSISHDFYPGARHEMLHETNRRDAITNLLVWISGVLDKVR